MAEKRISRFEAILSSFTDAVVTLDGAGRVEWLNNAAEQMLDVSLNVVAGSDVSALFPDGSPIRFAISQAAGSGVSFMDHDSVYRTRKGEDIPVGISVHPLSDDIEKGMVVIIRDLGVLKALERYMTMNDRMAQMASLAAGIAHEIKNPLGGIRGAAQLIQKEPGGEAMKEYVGLIISEVDRINRLVVDLIDLNKPGVLLKEPTNIYQILDEVLFLLKGEMDAKEIAIEREYDPSLPPVLGDADRLRQIFINLIKNAVEACERKGRVRLRTSLAWRAPLSVAGGRERRFSLIEIIDDGPGLGEEIKKRVFTPFVSTKPGGSGLGLSITLHLVQAHGGALEIKNRADRSGVVASVFLPHSS